MTTNAHPRPDVGTPKAAAPRRRLGWVVAAFLLLLLLGGGVGGGAWWYTHNGPAANDKKPPDENTPPPRTASLCSDEYDPKTLIHLDFGPPLDPGFDRRRLDALKDRPIPEVEKYPWQPKELVAVLGEHRMRGQLVAASPDGNLLAVGSPGDAYLRIGEVDTIHEKTLLVCPAGARALVWSPGGDALAVSCGDGQVRLFDVRDLEKIPDPAALEKPAALVTSLSYSADGKHLLGGDNASAEHKAWVWDVEHGTVVNKLQHSGPVMGVAFSPVRGDHRALTAGGPGDHRLHLWKDAVAGGGEDQTTIDLKEKKEDINFSVNAVAFSPDGKQAASSSSDLTVRLWDLDHFDVKQALHVIPHAGGSPLVAWSPDGRYLATTHLSADGVWLRDVKDVTQVRQIAASGGVSVLRFLAADRLVFAGTSSNDWNVHIHEVETGKERLPPVGHLTGVPCVAISPDGQRVASGGGDLTMRLWDLEKLEESHRVGSGDVWALGFHPDSKRVFYCGPAVATLPLVDFDSGQLRTPAYNNRHAGAVYTAAITRDGRYALTGSQDGAVRMWQLSDGRQVRAFDFGPGQGAAAVTVSPDMRRAVRAGGPRTRLLQLRCGETIHSWDAAVAWAPFLPDAQVAFFGGATAPLWQVADGAKETRQIGVNLSGMTATALSGDGKRAAAVLGGKAVVYDLETTKSVWEWTPPPHFGGVRGVALSFDGGDLLTANGDGTVYVIRTP